MRLKGRRVLIAGTSTGLGYAVAYFSINEGAEVVLNARSEKKLVEIVKSLGDKASYVVGDVSTPKGLGM